MNEKYVKKMLEWRADWNMFVRDVLKARLDKEQQAIIESVQHNPMTAVASGTARGKDFVAACSALCFMYLTPRWKNGVLVKNTKIAMTAPTDRQVKNIMVPEIRRLYKAAGVLPGRLVGYDIRTDYEEWFLTGFKAGDDNQEAWSGFHAANTMFIVTEASGISETTYNAIEGNLQGNSRFLIVFNPNTPTGYAAKAMVSDRFTKFRLNSLNAENVIAKREVIPGQVNYEWVKDKVDTWCSIIHKDDFNVGQGDFSFEGQLYRPNDLFRVKVLGLFPKVSEDTLISYDWVEIAVNRWRELKNEGFIPKKERIVGVDVAGMGRDDSVLCARYGNFVEELQTHQSGGHADHMHVVGMIEQHLRIPRTKAYIDTIGEGAGVLSRLMELGFRNAFSCKFSEGAAHYHDVTGEYKFANMRAYCFWALRDWLNPKNGYYPALPPDEKLIEELVNIKWRFMSDGSIMIEPKDDIKKRIKRSPDRVDALANTFYPKKNGILSNEEIYSICL